MPLEKGYAYSKVGSATGGKSVSLRSSLAGCTRKLCLVLVISFFLFVGVIIFSPQVRWEIYARHYAYAAQKLGLKKETVVGREWESVGYPQESEDIDDSDYDEAYDKNDINDEERDDVDDEERDDVDYEVIDNVDDDVIDNIDDEVVDNVDDEVVDNIIDEEIDNVDDNQKDREEHNDEREVVLDDVVEVEEEGNNTKEKLVGGNEDRAQEEGSQKGELANLPSENGKGNGEVKEKGKEIELEEEEDHVGIEEEGINNVMEEEEEEEGEEGDSNSIDSGIQDNETAVVVDTAQKEDTDFSQEDNNENLSIGKSGSLSKQFLLSHATNNRVIVTWANFHYLDFVKNWVYHLKKTGATNFVVGALDDPLLAELEKLQVPCFHINSSLPVTDFGWGTPTFHEMGRHKIRLVSQVTEMGIDLLLSDVDTVWLRDPNVFMDTYPDADVLTSSDNGRMTTRDGGLELYPEAGASANIGIMLFSKRAKLVGDEWMKRLEENSKLWDQQAFNEIMRQGMDFSLTNRREDRLFEGFDKQALFGILPVSLFCSGHNYFVQDMPAMINEIPYVVHATFQYGGTPGKRNRFRERLLWDNPPEYFTRPGGYLVFEPHIPDDLLNGKEAFSLEGHFKLVHHQMRQIRYAFALAHILDRAVIMPKIYCQYDRFWAPIMDGRFGSTDGPPPGEYFLCPMDHVFDMERMTRMSPDLSFEWREYSFLENPRLPEDVKSDAVIIKNGSTEGVKFPMTDKTLKAALGSDKYKDVKLLKFDNILDIFDGKAIYEDEIDNSKFFERVRHLTAIWCCVRPPEKGVPGHIWYDIWFDVIPHQDRHMRMITKEWVPNNNMLGP